MNASWDERDEVISAEDGEQALRYAREMQPDLVLLDLLLPKMTGTEVLARLKNEPATALLAVVVVSGLSERNRQKLIDAGADDYLEKSALMPDQGSISYPSCLSTSLDQPAARAIVPADVPAHRQLDSGERQSTLVESVRMRRVSSACASSRPAQHPHKTSSTIAPCQSCRSCPRGTH